ncbi:MAG: segregation/condensation protein A [Bacteroidota bacterium]
MESLQDTYRIKLQQFEGPFDLLLFFIERDELDIHDIPIAKITNDFLEYIHSMQAMNIELAAEFILVASTLMRIKAKMLLPRPILNEEGVEIDPREELVQRLLEYKRYKSVLAELSSMEEEQSQRVNRGFAAEEEKMVLQSDYPEEELVGMDLYTIMRVFKRIWEKHQNNLTKPKHVIRKYPYTVEERKIQIIDLVREQEKVDFLSLALEIHDRIYVIFTFLAILELVQTQKLWVVAGEGYNNFWVKSKTKTENEA